MNEMWVNGAGVAVQENAQQAGDQPQNKTRRSRFGHPPSKPIKNERGSDQLAADAPQQVPMHTIGSPLLKS